MRQSELQNIQDQIKGLYGPLFYFTSLNYDLFDLCRKLQNISGEYEDKITPENVQDVKELFDQLSKEGNSYVITDIIQNNEKIISLLEKNWYLIDLDDVEIFIKFLIDMAMYRRCKDQTPRTSLTIKKQIGYISFMRPEMIEKVKIKFSSKMERVKQLTQGRKTFCRKIGSILYRMLHSV